ncbi:hypothetical protein [Absidia glauca]|uniref:Uncharacterized protein n=1 Tax=Absidia glauca TaxID=4829 RepID=A0A163JCU3_ABSGL|nr:hypothetical protein [Absidia glauca]
MSTKDSAVLTLLQSLKKSQETRIALYQEFDDAYQDYLSGKCPPEQYHSICRIVTEGFSEVSLEIQAIEKQLSETHGRTDLANMIRRLQEAEREKLSNTAQLQIYVIGQKQGDTDYSQTIEEKKLWLQGNMATIQEVWDELRQETTDLSYAVDTAN